MKNYIYQNNLIGKKQLRQILGWSFTKYDSMQACTLADELKSLGFLYATKAGISISIEDLKVPYLKKTLIDRAEKEIINSEKIFLKGKITEVERFQNIINTWNTTSESLKDQVVNYFKSHDPLNSVYIMAFSGARGNLSQVRQLVGMRGLMSDPSGQIMNLPITKNFREGLTITDYLMSGYGARKGIVDTALKTANSGYLTRRLIDVAQDILIREKDCQTSDSILITKSYDDFNKTIGRILSKPVIDSKNSNVIAPINTQITPTLLNTFNQKKVNQFYIRSSLTCKLYRAVCQHCYGWDLATENLIDMGEAIGILAGQSIGEPGTQLTMRTFHTGGVFTSTIKEQLTSPIDGIVRFSKSLRTVPIRTNRGESVVITKTSGSLLLIPKLKNEELVKIDISPDTIVFPSNNQYVRKFSPIAEILDTDKQVKQEIKPIIVTTPGEVFIPKLKEKVDKLTTNKLIWLLYGNLYNSPVNSYINLCTDFKLNKNSFIFRTKIVNPFPGKALYLNTSKSLYRRNALIKNKASSLKDFRLFILSERIGNANSILCVKNLVYLLYSSVVNNKVYLKTTRKGQIAHLVNNSYKTRTGGTLYYDSRIQTDNTNLNLKTYLCIRFKDLSESFLNLNNQSEEEILTVWKTLRIRHRTLIWLEEETHLVNCEHDALLVKHGDFIAKNFEIMPGRFSKTSGLVMFELNPSNNELIKTIRVQSGLIYEGDSFVEQSKKIYFPGEQIFSNINISSPSLCQCIKKDNKDQLLICPLQLYEFPHVRSNDNKFITKSYDEETFKFKISSHPIYSSNQKIKFADSINLVLTSVLSEFSLCLNKSLSIELYNNDNNDRVNFQTFELCDFHDYITPGLKYKSLESCNLIQKNQFIDRYTTSFYLESVTSKYLEIVKIRISKSDTKKILLISNDDCVKVDKEKIPNNKINDFILNSTNINHVGKIILENKKFFIIQKGRPYFFPNCEATQVSQDINLTYKFVPSEYKKSNVNLMKKNIFLNSYDDLKISVEANFDTYFNTDNLWKFDKVNLPLKIEFSRMFLKKNGRLYSCLIPRFLKQFSIGSISNDSNLSHSKFFNYRNKEEETKLYRTIMIKNSETVSNVNDSFKLTLVKFLEYPFTKATKSVGLHSITDDFFGEKLNSVFCEDKQFLEDGTTIGLLHLEKEITGDIIQGLPKIEQILEARKKTQTLKRIPTSQKKGLLTQKTSLDHDFEFKKLGVPVKENERINPHKLLKVYFNYYGLLAPFFCDRQNKVKYARLTTNFEGSYKSFKKVQSFILNSVQSVYRSQGVNINDKHLEVIIKQMTTKVLVTDEGDTPLLKREIIDLYHIEHINRIVEKEQKIKAYYLPVLFGITRAALNNPSFISAASFQETTRVLTKSAIEGRIDWLRGLKENIIIGHLIPAGTGSQNYRTAFRNTSLKQKMLPVLR